MGKGANFLKKRTVSLLLAVLALVMCPVLFTSCGKEQSADKAFGAAMERVRNFDTDGFSQYFSGSAYFDAVMSDIGKVSEGGREALKTLYSGVSWEITEVGASSLSVKFVSFDFDKLSRYVEDAYALGTGIDKAEILLSLASGGRLSSYSATYGIKVNFEGEGDGIKIPFDTARNNDFVNALGLSRMISLFAK